MLSKQGVKVRQLLNHPTWLQLVHNTNCKNYLDVNSVIQPLNKVEKFFEIGNAAKQHLKLSYQDSLLRFLNEFILTNKCRVPILRRIRNTLTLFSPSIPLIYLWLSLRLRSILTTKNQQLSSQEARLVCRQYCTQNRVIQTEKKLSDRLE
jgi:hypothetical protein